MNNYSVSNNFKAEIRKYVVLDVFPSLNIGDITLLDSSLIYLLSIIGNSFLFNQTTYNDFENQLRQNNYRDCVGLMLLLIPFIDDDINSSKKHTLKSFDELYVGQQNNKSLDELKNEPKYEYSNVQYGRFDRGKNENVHYNEIFFMNNFNLLINTIQTVSHKLYINWLNVVPYSITTYKSTQLYKNTYDLFVNHPDQLSFFDPIVDYLDKPYPHTLYVGDIYDTISNELYHKVKNIKWMLYDIRTNKNLYPLIIILNEIFSNKLDNCTKQISWEETTIDDKNAFENDWKSFVEAGINTNSYKISSGIISGDQVKNILKSVMFFFNKYYSKLSDIIQKKKYIPFNKQLTESNNNNNNDDDDNPDDENLGDILINKDMIRSIKSLKMVDLYEFIKESLDKLSWTWYGKKIIVTKNIIGIKNYKNIQNPNRINNAEESEILIKTIYNYAKNLTHIQADNAYIEMERMFGSFDRNEKNFVISRLADTQNYEWFNISNYIRRAYQINDQRKISSKMKSTYFSIRNVIIDIVFESLIFRGVLSNFVTKPDITNAARFPNEDVWRNNVFDKVKEQNKKMNYWQDSYYYLTGDTYDKLQSKGKTTEPYLTHKDSLSWILTYAMDWVSQISFFHRYLNNRVFFVTGSTGVGKSTQVPKLLLYGLKMIDYKNNGRIVCTQPRISPTETNAYFISTEMGVQIFEKNTTPTDESIETNNYYLQFQYSTKKHTRADANHLSLIFSTDGLLLTELKNTLLKKRVLENESKTNNYVYSKENLYDIVVVDEVHEHNHNMDLILTQMRYAAYYNNSLRFVIISATMTDDEPVYRRYYRDINDNLLYPINSLLNEHALDRINIDRRIHISPPGVTTQHKINEVYLPNAEILDVVKDIVKTDKTGDILIFQPTTGTIKKLVDELNNNNILPEDTRALPYYSKLPIEKRDLVQNLNTTRNEIIIPKTLQFEDDIKDKSVLLRNGSFKRYVVVATNIAEASITYDNLKSVIETGCQNATDYDYLKDKVSASLVPISESSRIQRRGRVGRKSSGTVYYLYPEGSMINNKVKYTISTIDLSFVLFQFLRNSPSETPLFSDITDPNKNRVSVYEDIDMTILETKKENSKENLVDIIINQYYHKQSAPSENNTFLKTFVSYRGDPAQYDYANSKPPSVYYETGYDKQTLIDDAGDFYIVHPNEPYLKRNIIGNIVEYKQNRDKLFGMFDVLENYMFIYPISNQNSQNDAIKTEFGIQVIKFKEQIEFDDVKFVLAYLNAEKMDCGALLLKFMAFYNATQQSIQQSISSMITPTGKFRRNLPQAEKLYQSQHSDVESVLKIIKLVDEYICRPIGIVYDFSNSIDYKIIYEELVGLKNKFIKNKTALNKFIVRIFEKLCTENKIITTNVFLSNIEMAELLKSNILGQTILIKIKTHRDKIDESCKKYYLSSDVIVNYLELAIQYQTALFVAKSEDLDKSPDNTQADWFKSNLQIFPTADCEPEHLQITKSLLAGFYKNIVLHINKTPFYLNAYNMTDVLSIQTINPVIDILDTLVSSSALSEYLLFLNINSETESVSFISAIPTTMLKNVAHLYIQQIMRFKYNTLLETFIDNTTHSFSTNTNLPTNFCKNKPKSKSGAPDISILNLQKYGADLIVKYKTTIDKVKKDMLTSYDYGVWRLYSNLCKTLNKTGDTNQSTIINSGFLDSLEKKQLLIKQNGGSKQNTKSDSNSNSNTNTHINTHLGLNILNFLLNTEKN